MASSFLTLDCGNGITAIDSGLLRPGMACCYLVEAGDRLVVVETGINNTVERILDLVAERGFGVEDVSHVIVTHVHLDHAGGAGALMQRLPRAELLAHPRAVRHLVDPSRLEASARKVYGDAAFDAAYGHLQPIDDSRVRVMEDEDRLEVDGRSFRFIDAPGHARHHFVVWDELSQGWFTGDTFGISYRETDTDQGAMIFPTTTPIQFDPPAMIASIDRMMDVNPAALYLTHFGRVTDTQRLAEELKEGVRFFDALAQEHQQAPDRTAAIQRDMGNWLIGRARDHGCTQPDTALAEVFKNDVVLNTQGLEFMLDHPR